MSNLEILDKMLKLAKSLDYLEKYKKELIDLLWEMYVTEA